MKKLIVVAVLALVAVALTTPVSAQDAFGRALQNTMDVANQPMRILGQNLCDTHRGTGDAMEASWCYGVSRDPVSGRFEGYNPTSVAGQRARGFRADDLQRSRYYDQRSGGYYDGRYYGHRSGVARFLNHVFGSEYGYYGYSGNYGWGPTVSYSRSYDRETAGKCFERVAKASRKEHVSITASEISAYCSGQPLPDGRSESSMDPDMPTPEPPPAPRVSPAPAPAPRQSVERHAAEPAAVYTQGDKLCNDTNQTIAIFVDGNRVGNLASHQVLTLSRIPKGTLSYYPIGN